MSIPLSLVVPEGTPQSENLYFSPFFHWRIYFSFTFGYPSLCLYMRVFTVMCETPFPRDLALVTMINKNAIG